MYVYFIKAFGQHPMIKIGKSKNPKSRLSELQVGSPVKLTLMGTVRCQSDYHALQVEKLAHHLFRKQNRRGEWFRMAEGAEDMINRLVTRVAAEHASTDAGNALCAELDREVGRIVG